MSLQADTGRTPLLTHILDLRPGGEAHAQVQLDPAGAGLGEGPSLALCLEAMAEVASLVFAHRHLVRIDKATLNTQVSGKSLQAVTASARCNRSLLDVKLEQVFHGAPARVFATASLEWADSPLPAPLLPADPALALERRGRSHNGDALHAAVEGAKGQPAADASMLSWAAPTGLGRLAGALAARGPHFGHWPASLPLPSCPGVVEGLCRLVEWQWFALAGQGGRVQAVERIGCYRIPRADEALLGSVACRGGDGGSACFDAVAFGHDRRPVLELRGIRLQPKPLAGDPREAWQSFARWLEPGQPVAA